MNRVDLPQDRCTCSVPKRRAGSVLCQACLGNLAVDLIPGLEKAERIVNSRLATAKALDCGIEYTTAISEILIFIQAELSRQRRGETGSGTTTAEFK